MHHQFRIFLFEIAEWKRKKHATALVTQWKNDELKWKFLIRYIKFTQFDDEYCSNRAPFVSHSIVIFLFRVNTKHWFCYRVSFTNVQPGLTLLKIFAIFKKNALLLLLLYICFLSVCFARCLCIFAWGLRRKMCAATLSTQSFGHTLCSSFSILKSIKVSLFMFRERICTRRHRQYITKRRASGHAHPTNFNNNNEQSLNETMHCSQNIIITLHVLSYLAHMEHNMPHPYIIEVAKIYMLVSLIPIFKQNHWVFESFFCVSTVFCFWIFICFYLSRALSLSLTIEIRMRKLRHFLLMSSLANEFTYFVKWIAWWATRRTNSQTKSVWNEIIMQAHNRNNIIIKMNGANVSARQCY